jgi:putative exporter of polyketide antibiotics
MNFFTFLAVITCCAILAIAYIVDSARTVTPNYLIKQEKYHA